MKICVQGLWHLGSVTAACLASRGVRVVGLDFEAGIIESLGQGVPPLFEPGLEDLVRQGIRTGQLSFSTDPEEALTAAEVLWVAYDTPVDNDDNADVEFVIAQIEKSVPHLADGAIVLISSQLPVGSVKRLEAYRAEHLSDKTISFAYSPENLRLGKALDVFLNPDRVVVGVRSGYEQEVIGRLISHITDRIEWMSVESAEMTKHAINAFLATSVTFANEIAAICEIVGADAKEVERGLKTEARIGPKAYLSPGGPFAGGTLARDVEFLKVIGGRQNLPTPVLSSVRISNDEHKNWVRRKLLALFPSFPRVCLTVWGLTYKPETDTLRRSLSVELVDWLLDQGVQVHVHDPVVKTLPEHWVGRVKRHDDPLSSLEEAQALVIGTEWSNYRQIPAIDLYNANPALTVIDANRFMAPIVSTLPLAYVAVGIPEKAYKD